MRKQCIVLAIIIIATINHKAFAESITPIVGLNGEYEAYILNDYELTIYDYNGNPISYIEKSFSGKFYVYDFNGSYIGLMDKGIITDSDGYAACVLSPASRYYGITINSIEPMRSFRTFPPFKMMKKYRPYTQDDIKMYSSKYPCRMVLSGNAG